MCYVSREEEVGLMDGKVVGKARRGGEIRVDETIAKLKVSVQRAGALWFGIAVDVNCDLCVTLTHCQQSLPLLEVSPAAAICTVV